MLNKIAYNEISSDPSVIEVTSIQLQTLRCNALHIACLTGVDYIILEFVTSILTGFQRLDYV